MNKRQQIQHEAKQCFLDNACLGILCIAQRTGKIKISLDIMTHLLDEGELHRDSKILIAYPDNRIKDSWIQDIDKWKFKFPMDNILFVNYASLYKHEMVPFDMVVFDEIHATSEAQRESIRLLVDTTDRVLGLSGTISEDTERELKDLGLHIIMRYSVEDAIQDEIIAPYKIHIHMVSLDTVKKKLNKKGKMVSEKQQYDAYTWVIDKMKAEHKDFKFLALHRNRVLQSSYAKQLKTINLLKEHANKKVLVFTGLKKVSESLGIPYFHSTSQHTGVFEDFKTSENAKLAVVNIGRAGVTFDQLDCIIINSFTGNEETTEQIIARALNRDVQDKVAEIHIICSNELAEIRKLTKTITSFNKDNVIWHK